MVFRTERKQARIFMAWNVRLSHTFCANWDFIMLSAPAHAYLHSIMQPTFLVFRWLLTPETMIA